MQEQYKTVGQASIDMATRTIDTAFRSDKGAVQVITYNILAIGRNVGDEAAMNAAVSAISAIKDVQKAKQLSTVLNEISSNTKSGEFMRMCADVLSRYTSDLGNAFIYMHKLSNYADSNKTWSNAQAALRMIGLAPMQRAV